MVRGNLVHDVQKIHTKYGNIVRLAPNELSFAQGQAYIDIHGGRPPFPKNRIWWQEPEGMTDGILVVQNPADHSRMRKLLSHGFTEKAVREQEPMINKYVSLLISRLRGLAASSKTDGAIVDIIKWYDFCFFDLTGDLAFAESFGCLEDSKYHSWVALLFNAFKIFVYMTAVRFFPFLNAITTRCIPRSAIRTRDEHRQLSNDKTNRRLNLETSRPDLMSHVLKHNDEKGMTVEEIESTFFFLILAGSETGSTTLGGITSYLIRDSARRAILTEEVRNAFAKEDDITATALKELPYLNAVIEEGLRITPAVPSGLARVVPPGGGIVCGQELAGNTHVSVHPWTIARSTQNYYLPDSFLPERWLPSARDADSPFSGDRPSEHYPFSIGPRSCMGKLLAYTEMRLVLARMVWAFDIEMTEEATNFRWEKLKTWILVERVPLFIKISQRK